MLWSDIGLFGGYDYDSTAIRPLDDLRRDRTPTCVWADMRCGLNKTDR